MTARVLHVLSQRPGWTGSGVALDAIVRAAGRHGWQQMAVVGTATEDPWPEVADLDRTRIRPLVFGRESLPFAIPGMSDVMPYPSSRFSELTGEQLAAYRNAWRTHIAAVIEEFQPDVIHSNHLWLVSAMVKEIAPAIPVVTHCHGTGLRQLALCPHLAAEVLSGCSRNTAFVVLHQGHARVLAEQFGVDTARIEIVGSGFDSQIFYRGERPTECGRTITYAGKLSQAKGLPWLLEAFNELAQRLPGLSLNIAGSGAGDQAETILARMKTMDKVVFHGQLSQRQLADLLRRSAVFVLPSFFEGLPLVLVEAAACGCRVVATELPGVVDQLSSRLGPCLEIVPLPRLKNADQPVAEDLPRFVEALVSALERSLARPQPENSYALVAEMTWNAVFRRIESVWQRVLVD